MTATNVQTLLTSGMITTVIRCPMEQVKSCQAAEKLPIATADEHLESTDLDERILLYSKLVKTHQLRCGGNLRRHLEATSFRVWCANKNTNID